MSLLAGHAIFLDRDGILVSLVHDSLTDSAESPYRRDDVTLEPGVEALLALTDLGAPLVVASNQPAIAKGNVSWSALHAVHERVDQLLRQAGIAIQRYGYCYHHPEARIPELRRRCDCRKPNPGLLLDAAQALGVDMRGSWMIGDSDTDVTAGKRAGCYTVLVANPKSGHRRNGESTPDISAADVPSAVAGILERIR